MLESELFYVRMSVAKENCTCDKTDWFIPCN